jgi:3-deoxy-D-manno-octulosonic-acid transferase
VNFLLENHAERETMMKAGLTAVEQMSGALSRTLIALEPFLHPLIVKSRLQRGGER